LIERLAEIRRRSRRRARRPVSAEVCDLVMSGNGLTAAELEQMSPAERHALFESSIVTDLDEAPQHLVERARARAERHIAESESRIG